MTLKLDRPLAILDIETTSIDVNTARIVQIGYIVLIDNRLEDDAHEKKRLIANREAEFLINPGIPIPPEASAVHGITDAMVVDKPKFVDVASTIIKDLKNCDLAGFNIEKFDLPILARHFAEYEIDFPKDRRIIDAMTICHRNEKRDLAWATRFYLGREHDNAHDAFADASTTAEILIKQVERYGLPQDIPSLDLYCHEKPAEYVDQEGKLQWRGDEAFFSFGKVKGMTLRQAAKSNADYLRWILGADFSPEFKQIVSDALSGRFPVRRIEQ